MGSRRRLITGRALASGLYLGAAALSLGGCKKKVEPAKPAPVESAMPVDRLAPGELPEGREVAFGLKLPQGMGIARGFPGVVHATSTTLRPEQVANYFRARVVDGTVSAGAVGTRFIDVHAKTDPKRELAIEIRAGAPGVTTCEVLLRDTTPPPVEPGLSEDERRRKAGLTPDGKLLDPKHME
ncbi:hypothetical protein AKJ09_06079 [Labilithrix luteola]|uniref:Lipoprotein n=1 Tax=Labilithrix luteola TaxID=1391654 RepID=A0A0K1Q0V4_9BACT|nr:hypothetical protein [Labilithrix luteola]AKU99415.1 hypothetical protein AKJ09_06079 [Labilithrix luteola]